MGADIHNIKADEEIQDIRANGRKYQVLKADERRYRDYKGGLAQISMIYERTGAYILYIRVDGRRYLSYKDGDIRFYGRVSA